MTDQETIDQITARLRDDITIHKVNFRTGFGEYHVTIEDDVTVFSLAKCGPSALQNARRFAQARQQGTSRQIRERI